MQLRYSHDLPPFLFGLPAIADRQVLKHSVSVRPIISRSTLLCWTLETENGWVAVQRSYAVFCGYVAIYFKLSTAAPPQPENSEARPQIQKLFQGSPANGIHFSIPSRLVFCTFLRALSEHNVHLWAAYKWPICTLPVLVLQPDQFQMRSLLVNILQVHGDSWPQHF